MFRILKEKNNLKILQQYKKLPIDIPIWKCIIFSIFFQKFLGNFEVTYLLLDKTYINQIW